MLDEYAAAGGNFLDTADTYTSWVSDSSVGGESEEIIGRWMERRGNRDEIVLATKVGKAPGLEGLSATTIRRAVEGSLARLKTDRIDLYYAHADDTDTPLEETLTAFDALVREGKVRYIAASNYGADRLAAALAVSDAEGLARYVAIQPHYNLVHRADYEGALSELCRREGIACVPYYALANGFLTGKYRTADVTGVEPTARRVLPRTSRARGWRPWRPSTRWRPRARRRSQRSRWRGLPRNRPWSLQSPAPARPTRRASSSRWRRFVSPTKSSTRWALRPSRAERSAFAARPVYTPCLSGRRPAGSARSTAPRTRW